MRVLITGGAGFIAFHLAKALQKRGDEVVLLDNFNDYYDPEIKRRNVADLQSSGYMPLHVVDILDRDSMEKVFEDTRPETVVHLAAWAGVRPLHRGSELYSAVNAGTVNMLELAKKFSTGCHVRVFLSGAAGTPRFPSEDDPVDRPVSVCRDEEGGRASATPTHILMHITASVFTVYGPGSVEMAIHKFARLMYDGKEIPCAASVPGAITRMSKA